MIFVQCRYLYGDQGRPAKPEEAHPHADLLGVVVLAHEEIVYLPRSSHRSGRRLRSPQTALRPPQIVRCALPPYAPFSRGYDHAVLPTVH